MGSADQILAMVLPNPTPRSCWAAIDQFAQLGGAAVDALIPLLAHSDQQIQIMAARSLAKIRQPAQRAAEALLQQLFAHDPPVRLAAAQALLQLSPPLKPALPLLIGRLQAESDFATQMVLAQLCGSIGPQAEQAIPLILPMLEQAQHVAHARALLSALGQIDPQHPQLLLLLRERLRHTTDPTCVAAAQVVGVLRLQAPIWAELLQRAAGSSNRQLRHAARLALQRIRSQR